MIQSALKTGLAASALLLLILLAWESVPERRTMAPVASGAPKLAERMAYVGRIPRLNVAFAATDGRLFGIEDHFLFVSEDGGRTFERRGQLPKKEEGLLSRVADWVARLKPVRLIRRNEGPENLVVLESGTVLVFWDRIYRSVDGGNSFTVAADFSRDQLVQPFGNNEGIAVGPDGVYFGEYTSVARPHAIRIVAGTNDGQDWNVVYTFPPGDIFHVHSIAYDRFRKRYWICTGDNDDESRILYSEDGFRTLQKLGGGSQAWRAVSVMITPDSLVWGSDNDRDGARIYRWRFPVDQLEELATIGKPSYSSAVLADGSLVLSTAYEPASAYVRAFQPTPSTDLWLSEDGSRWRQILSLPYERHETPSSGPSRASIAFPNGAPLKQLIFMPQSTAGDDFDVLIADRRSD